MTPMNYLESLKNDLKSTKKSNDLSSFEIKNKKLFFWIQLPESGSVDDGWRKFGSNVDFSVTISKALISGANVAPEKKHYESSFKMFL